MNALRLIAAGFLMLGIVAGVRAEDKVSKDNIVGSWEVTKSEEPPPPVGSVVEFGKDGKMKVVRKQDGKDMTIEGTYTFKDDKIDMVLKIEDKEVKHSITIKKVDGDVISVENEKGKTLELKRKKASS